MKLKKVVIKNVKSFKDRIEIEFNDDFNILIGPNGSGKSNILDILTISIRHFFLKPYQVIENTDQTGFFKNITNFNPFGNINQVLDKFYGDSSDSEIIFEFVVKREDIANIDEIIRNISILEDKIREYRSYPNVFPQIRRWNEHSLQEDEIIVYSINNNQLLAYQETQNKRIFYEYLNYFELLLILIREINEININSNYLYFSPYRGANLQNLQANLSSQSFYQVLQSVVNATSKTVFSLINLATIYFAAKRRKFEDEATNRGYIHLWESDDEVKLVSKYLKKLGYDWTLKLIDKNKNIYEILLSKEGKEFYINQASSGEKEIINFLLGVFAFNINNGIIIIDEPELHLHPKWQNLLLELFIELSSSTKNQFIISTHSPVFINDRSYNHIFRIYKDKNNTSKVTVLKDNEHLKLKNILHIINNTNNEKIFFADIVILVEGITDRLIFQKILSEYLENSNITRIVEIIEIKGKSNVNSFREFVESLNIPVFFISDLDYINEISDDSLKKLFITNARKIDKDVVKNPKSRDGYSLIEAIEQAIEENNFENLKKLLEYIKSFRRKLKSDLSQDEKKMLVDFIEDQQKNNIYILQHGDIEDYFLDGFKTKDLDNVINLLKDENYSKWKQTEKFKELSQIINDILNKCNLNTT